MAEIVLITGLSGAGRSGAAAVLEDLGYYVIDNLPSSLLPHIADLAGQPGGEVQRLALVSGRNHANVAPAIDQMIADGHEIRVLFLDASTQVLVQRYDATRRKHPYAVDGRGVLEAIDHERELLDPLRSRADLTIDTSDLNVHQLKERLVQSFGPASSVDRLNVAVESFGFKNGLPLDADIVMDVRFVPNPHWVEELRPYTGLDDPVRSYVLDGDGTEAFLDDFERLLVGVLPRYRAEGRAYLTIALGCTGGKHRSVALAEELGRRLADADVSVAVSHRDLPR